MTNYGAISLYSIAGIYTWLLGFPIVKQETSSHLKINIYTPKGETIGSYAVNMDNVYRKSRYGLIKFGKTLPSKTNITFSNSVMQIREQILKDISKYNN